MISLTSQLEVARRALQAHQLAMSVIGNNIANVNTDGFSRRRAMLRSTQDLQTIGGTVGTGVEVVNIDRVRDTLLDSLYRSQMASAGEWSLRQNYYSRIESVWGEPGESGLSDAMSEFWTSWQDLANQPDSSAAREQVRAKGERLTDVFHRLDAHLRELQGNIVSEVEASVERVNQISTRIGELNLMITEGEFGGHQASSLRDERDILIDELSGLVDTSYVEQPSGAVSVMIGSQILVQESYSRQLAVETGLTSGADSIELTWADSALEVQIRGGTLHGALDMHDKDIDGYLTELDSLAAGLVEELNSLHREGVGLDGSTGNSFFSAAGVTAASIRLDDSVLSDSAVIAASVTGQSGDGQNALAIANLSTKRIMSGGQLTFSGFFEGLTGRVGLHSQEARSFTEAEETLLLDLETRRMETSGVSMDEEMSYLLSFQHAYEAMIRVSGAIDEMTTDLIAAYGH